MVDKQGKQQMRLRGNDGRERLLSCSVCWRKHWDAAINQPKAAIDLPVWRRLDSNRPVRTDATTETSSPAAVTLDGAHQGCGPDSEPGTVQAGYVPREAKITPEQPPERLHRGQ